MWRHHSAHGVADRHVGVRQDVGERRSLALLDLTDHRHAEPLGAAEVVDQHPVAGADPRRELAQAQVRDAADGDVVDDRIEHPLPGI